MPRMGSFGGSSWNAFKSKGIKPIMLQTGAGGTITPTTQGYDLSGFAGLFAFAYLATPKTTGKWYWEYKYTSTGGSLGFNFTGVTDDPTTAVGNGGYSNANAGLYSFGTQLWVDAGWAGGAVGLPGPGTPSTNDILGLALDMASATKTLKLYINNALICTISWTAALTLYPLFAFQGGSTPTGSVQLGTHCTYPPPAGYNYY